MNSLIAGISITCFASAYLMALTLEITRLFFRSGVRGALLIGFSAAGFLAHTLYLGHRAATASASPLSSAYDWSLVAAWMLVASYLYVSYTFPKTSTGLVVLPLVLALIAGAYRFADRTPIAPEPASRIWASIHGLFLLLGAVAVIVGFAAGVMYLAQSYRLKHKLPPMRGLRFPSLEWLERVNSRVVVLSVILVGVGFISGVLLVAISGPDAGGFGWTDPVIVSSGVMFVWLVISALFNALYRPARHGNKVAYLTLANFVFLVMVLAIFLREGHAHGAPKQGAAANHAARESSVASEPAPLTLSNSLGLVNPRRHRNCGDAHASDHRRRV